MNYKVIYGKNDLVYTGFLALPGKLYQKNEMTLEYEKEYVRIPPENLKEPQLSLVGPALEASK